MKTHTEVKAKTKIPTHRKGVDLLPVTPKGEQLDNHFGS
jgi:hypothetical protein